MVKHMAHGYGKIVNFDGNIYTGHWKKGKIHGQGELNNPLLNKRYEGGFKMGKKHGFGKDVNERNCYEYEGFYHEGKMHGEGRIRSWRIINHEITYIGGFKDGRKNGLGVIYTSNWKYLGEFKDNKWHGFGEAYSEV